jgi:biopolymer transport protein ExbD
MAMSVKSGGGGDEAAPVAEINVTPLVDVMLVLLIIFMVSMPLMLNQLSIEIPKKSLAPPSGPPKDPLIFSIDELGNYSIEQDRVTRPVTYDQLPNELISLAKDYGGDLVFVRGNTHIDYGRVVGLIEMIGKAGFNKVTLMQDDGSMGGGISAVPVPAPGR